jgi:hypothetical protein
MTDAMSQVREAATFLLERLDDFDRADRATLLAKYDAMRAELDAAREELREVREAAGETLDTYAKSFRKMACEEYLVDALTFKGSSDNVKLAYGRSQGIEMARDRLAAALKEKEQ